MLQALFWHLLAIASLSSPAIGAAAQAVDLSNWIVDTSYKAINRHALVFLASGDAVGSLVAPLLTAAYSVLRQKRDVDIVVLTDRVAQPTVAEGLQHLSLGDAAYTLTLTMPYYGHNHVADWCPEEGEFLHIAQQKLVVVGLTQYEAVLFMDIDAVLETGAQELFQIDGIFRGAPGPCEAVSAGV